MSRTTTTTKTTTVRYLAKPLGRAAENGPHLVDLREFVALCDGLPDELRVSIQNGHLDEGGRHNVTFSVTHQEPVK